MTRPSIVHQVWFWILGRLRIRFIDTTRQDGINSRYMERHHLVQIRAKGRQLLRAYLHRYIVGDADAALHRHPFRWCIGIPIVGGYDELRLDGWSDSMQPVIKRRTVKWLRPNLIRGNDYHQVVSVKPGTITLFISGPRLPSWAFMGKAEGGAWADFPTFEGKQGTGWLATAKLARNADRAPCGFWLNPDYDATAPAERQASKRPIMDAAEAPTSIAA